MVYAIDYKTCNFFSFFFFHNQCFCPFICRIWKDPLSRCFCKRKISSENRFTGGENTSRCYGHCLIWKHCLILILSFHLNKTACAFIYEPPRDKTNNVAVNPAKTQISLDIRPVWSDSLLCAQWVAKGPSLLHADSEDSDQTGRMPRLICVFAGGNFTLLLLLRGVPYAEMLQYSRQNELLFTTEVENSL